MKTIRTIELSGSTRQERLPGFAEDFPFIASWAETGQYNGGMVPWHWHPAVELFYMYSGSLVYETPQGTRTFGPGSGGLVNANVLHSTRNLPGDRVVSWIHLFEPSLLGGSVGALLGMHVFRHKTRHWYFRWGIPAIFLLQLAACGAVWYLGR